MQVAQQAKRRRNKHSHESANEHLESDQKTIKDRKNRPHCSGGGLSSLLCAFTDHNFEEEKKRVTKRLKQEKTVFENKNAVLFLSIHKSTCRRRKSTPEEETEKEKLAVRRRKKKKSETRTNEDKERKKQRRYISTFVVTSCWTSIEEMATQTSNA